MRKAPATKPQSINLGILQTDAETASKRLKASQRALQKAQEEYTAAATANERARVALNQGVNTLKALIAVSDFHAD